MLPGLYAVSFPSVGKRALPKVEKKSCGAIQSSRPLAESARMQWEGEER